MVDKNKDKISGNLYEFMSREKLWRLYDLIPWEKVFLEFSVKQYNSFDIIQLFKIHLLPFLLNYHSERRLMDDFEENPILQILCGFIPGDELPARGTTWNFRRLNSEKFTKTMQYLLISLALKNQIYYRYRLPCIRILSDIELENSDWKKGKIEAHGTELEFEFLTQKGRSEKDVNNLEIQDKSRLPKAQTWAEWGKIQNEIAESKDKSWLSDYAITPIYVKTNYQNEEIFFKIVLPQWIGEYSKSLDTVNIASSASNKLSYIACNVLITREENGKIEILLAERLSGFGKGEFTLPGGKKKTNDKKIEDCVIREVSEETGLQILRSKPVSIQVTNYKNKPWVVSVGALAEEYEGQLQHIDKNKLDEWKWYPLDNLPEPLFSPGKIVIKHYLANSFPNLSWKDIDYHELLEESLF